MNTTVILYGDMAEEFGREHRFNIATPAEALKALAANFKSFRKYLQETSSEFAFFVNDEPVTHSRELDLTVGQNATVKIIPVVEGAGGFFSIVVGVIMMFIPGMQMMGLAMIVSGLAQVLFAPPKPSKSDQSSTETSPSYAFNGPVNTVAQGNCVPVGYGELEIGSQVISGGLTVGTTV